MRILLRKLPYNLLAIFLNTYLLLNVELLELFDFFFCCAYFIQNFLFLLLIYHPIVLLSKVIDLMFENVDHFFAIFYFFFCCLGLYLFADGFLIWFGAKMFDEIHSVSVHLLKNGFQSMLFFIDVESVLFIVFYIG